MRQGRKWAAGIGFFLSTALFAGSLHCLAGAVRERQEAGRLQEWLEAVYVGKEAASYGECQQNGAQSLDNQDAPMPELPDAEPGQEQMASPGLLALHAENPDCIGWLTIGGTQVSYPVMYHPEEENYYLKRDFYGDTSASGSLFLSELCDPDDSGNLIIYGHHMKDGTMFAALDSYKDLDFYLEHPVVSFDTLHGMEQYQIFAVFCTPVYTGNDFAYYGFTGEGTEEEFDTFLREVRARALYDTGVATAYGDQLLTLSTCEYSQANGRIVIVAKRINENTGNGGFYDEWKKE